MDKTVKLKDGSEIRIRPMEEDDLDRSFAFFEELPEEDRVFLRADVSKRARLEQRFQAVRSGHVKRLVALLDDKIVADGVLELSGHGWEDHVGELRLIVARPLQRKGLGRRMARELYALASGAKIEEIVVKMMRPQKAARRIFRKLGFREEVTLPDFVKDLRGEKQDLILMRCDLKNLWEEYESGLAASDWQRVR